MKKGYYTIGEVCNLLKVKPHVLRYWETRIPAVKPHKSTGGSRLYTHEDVERLKQVQSMLQDEGFTIEGVKKRVRKDKPKNPEPQLEIDFGGGTSQRKNLIRKRLEDLRDSLLKLLTS